MARDVLTTIKLKKDMDIKEDEVVEVLDLSNKRKCLISESETDRALTHTEEKPIINEFSDDCENPNEGITPSSSF